LIEEDSKDVSVNILIEEALVLF